MWSWKGFKDLLWWNLTHSPLLPTQTRIMTWREFSGRFKVTRRAALSEIRSCRTFFEPQNANPTPPRVRFSKRSGQQSVLCLKGKVSCGKSSVVARPQRTQTWAWGLQVRAVGSFELSAAGLLLKIVLHSTKLFRVKSNCQFGANTGLFVSQLFNDLLQNCKKR